MRLRAGNARGIQPTIWFVACVSIGASGCFSRTAPPIASSAQPIRETEPQSTDIHFTVAAFFKPREVVHDYLDAALAPLIVQQLHEESGDRLDENAARLTAYFGERTVADRGNRYRQIYYVWCYPRDRENGCPDYSGILMTLGDDGFPMLWEPLHRVFETIADDAVGIANADSKSRHMIYVSSSLEQLAEEEFGEPLPGRRFSVERAVGDSSHVVVAELVDDGPIPMGPYVYLGVDKHDVRAVVCRCSPSQVDFFATTQVYDIHPVADAHGLAVSLPEFRPSEMLRWPLSDDK